jgi:hypothetical protein
MVLDDVPLVGLSALPTLDDRYNFYEATKSQLPEIPFALAFLRLVNRGIR